MKINGLQICLYNRKSFQPHSQQQESEPTMVRLPGYSHNNYMLVLLSHSYVEPENVVPGLNPEYHKNNQRYEDNITNSPK